MVPFGPQIEPYQTNNCFITKDPLLMARESWFEDSDFMIGGCSNEGDNFDNLNFQINIFFLVGLIMGFGFNLANDYTALTTLQNSNYFAPLLETGLAVDDPKAEEFGKILKQFYYGCTVPSKTNIEGYYCFANDYIFWHGIQRAVQVRAASKGKGKTFLYRFDVVTGMNYIKRLARAEEYSGAEHCADVVHLFSGTVQPPPSIDSIEFENIKKTVAIWTSFAMTGNPNCPEWEPIDGAEIPLKCFEIGTKSCSFIELPETERLNVWNSIYQQAGIDLF